MKTYNAFDNAADAAFTELNSASYPLAIVVPTEDGNWRILHSLNKAALKTNEQRLWASMWEQISRMSPEERPTFLSERLKLLVGEQHRLALKAIHELEFSDDSFIRSNEGIGCSEDQQDFVSDHTGYGEGGENFEHDDTGTMMNYSGCVDDAYNAIKVHEGWEEGFDY